MATDCEDLVDEVFQRVNIGGSEEKSQIWRYQIGLWISSALSKLGVMVSNSDQWELLTKDHLITIVAGKGALPANILPETIKKYAAYETTTSGTLNTLPLEWRQHLEDLTWGGKSLEWLYYTTQAGTAGGGYVYVRKGDGSIPGTTQVQVKASYCPVIDGGATPNGGLSEVPSQVYDNLVDILAEWAKRGKANEAANPGNN